MDRDIELVLRLAETRAALRQVVSYQQALLSWLRFVSVRLPQVGLAPCIVEWGPLRHSRPPERNKAPYERWAWDGLPYHSLWIGWRNGDPNPGSLRCGLSITLDDGWGSAGSGEPLPENMPAVETCRSLVHGWAYRMVEKNGAQTWDEVWRRRQKAQPKQHEIEEDGRPVFCDLNGMTFHLMGFVVDMADLPDREAWEREVVGRLRSFIGVTAPPAR